MDQKKIGEFIASIRKEKEMTQKELAEKLNISINAVSKWERGICMMDISLLKPLSEILNVTIAEILSGERIDNDINKTNEVLEESLKYSNKKIKDVKRKNRVVLIIFLLIFIIVFYKIFLIYIIKNFENEIKKQNYGSQNYNYPIYITNIKTDNYYIFNKMKIKNIFTNAELLESDPEFDESIGFQMNDNQKIVLNINTINTNYLEEFKDYKYIVNYSKYLKKYNIIDEFSVYKFLSNFQLENKSIFTSINKLKDYLFKVSFYYLTTSNFNDLYELKGDLNGYIISSDTITTYVMYYDDIEYRVFFVGNYSLKETKDIISTIEFIR